MALTGIIIENPALEEVGLPIQVSEYDIQREINAAGSWAVSFPANQTLANQVKSRWRVSIVEEGRADYLLRRGVVLTRNYRVNADGTGILTLAGYTRLYTLTAGSTHFNLVYDGALPVSDIAEDLAGEIFTSPDNASSIFPKVTFSEISKLGALLKIGEMARYNLRETFDEDSFEFVKWDDVPDSGFRFVTVEHAGPELENAHENGMGLIAGTPTIGYDGKDLATRIIPIGVEFDGAPLELDESDKSAPYTIQTGTNPDSTSFYYLEDADAVEAVGLIELQYHRQDVKNPSDDADTRLASANALYKLAVGELQRRKSDVISFACEIANGRHIDALPGDRVRVQFRGRARTLSGFLTWQDIDQDFLIVKRRDAAGPAGVRGVSFTLAAPEVPLEDPELPDAVPIPPPPRDVPDPPEPKTNDDNYDPYNDPASDEGAPDVPGFEDPGVPEVPDGGAIADLPPFDPNGPNPYQTCCAPPTEINDIPDEEYGGGPGPGGGSLTISKWTGQYLYAGDYVFGLGPNSETPSGGITGSFITVNEFVSEAARHVQSGMDGAELYDGAFLIQATADGAVLDQLIDGCVVRNAHSTSHTSDVQTTRLTGPFPDEELWGVSISLSAGAGDIAAYVFHGGGGASFYDVDPAGVPSGWSDVHGWSGAHREGAGGTVAFTMRQAHLAQGYAILAGVVFHP